MRSGNTVHGTHRGSPIVGIFDVHNHLASRDFDGDRQDVITRAQDAGIVASIVVGENYEDNLRVLELASSTSFVLPAIGHHPWYMDRAGEDVPRTLRLIEENRDHLVAIGEVGLDYRVAETAAARADQRAVFDELISAGIELDLPLSVHVRSAGHYVLDMLRERGTTRAALHAFDGKARYALQGAADGYMFSVPATVLVSRQKQKLVEALPDHSLLLESDAPALSPHRGVRNEPDSIAMFIDCIAEIRGTTPGHIAALTTRNAERFFNLDI